MSVVSDTSHNLEALFYSTGWAKKGSSSCSSTGRHVLCICLQTQGVSAVTGHVGRTHIYTAASEKSLSWDRQSEDKNTWVVSTRPFRAWQTPRCNVERAAVARCPLAQSAAAMHTPSRDSRMGILQLAPAPPDWMLWGWFVCLTENRLSVSC